MDKTLLKAYIRTVVEEEVKKLLPELLGEAVSQIKEAAPQQRMWTENTVTDQPVREPIDRGKLAELLNIDYNRESGTIQATTKSLNKRLPEDAPPQQNDAVVDAINRDYSELMKKMKIV